MLEHSEQSVVGHIVDRVSKVRENVTPTIS